MRILVTGASGFIGSLLVPRLLADGHTVRALGRDPARVSMALAGGTPERPPFMPASTDRVSVASDRDPLAEVEVFRGDAISGAGLDAALAGIEVAYYLIHSMERPTGESTPFDERERVAAHNFAEACSRAGVTRIVYLGGLVPRDRSASRHLASRESVERILLDAVPDSLALRASIVIGARSRSFRFLVRLVERLPVLTLPAWRSFRTQPIDERDVIAMLAAAATATIATATVATSSGSGCSLDIGGPDVLTYEELISRIAEQMLVRRPVFGFGVNFTPITGRVAAAIAAEDPELILPLMEGLQGDLLPGDSTASELLDVELHSFDSAVEHALRVWEEFEPLAAR
jgi:uncharacterized protein YbjT (DUF2867 family)